MDILNHNIKGSFFVILRHPEIDFGGANHPREKWRLCKSRRLQKKILTRKEERITPIIYHIKYKDLK